MATVHEGTDGLTIHFGDSKYEHSDGESRSPSMGTSPNRRRRRKTKRNSHNPVKLPAIQNRQEGNNYCGGLAIMFVPCCVFGAISYYLYSSFLSNLNVYRGKPIQRSS